jgi:hypothetical protein
MSFFFPYDSHQCFFVPILKRIVIQYDVEDLKGQL